MTRKKIKPRARPWLARQPKGDKEQQTGRKVDNYAFYNSRQWRRVAKAVERRDKYICQECLRGGKVVDASGRNGATDHIIGLNKWVAQGGDPYDKKNLERLCKTCHAKKSGRERHTNNDNNESR